MQQESPPIGQVREDAISQLKRRVVIQFKLPDDEKATEIAKKIFNRAVSYAEKFHREHQRDDLPHERVQRVDEQTAEIFEWQDEVSLKVLQEEQKMTLIGFFTAMGVERSIAGAIVDYIIEKDR